METMIHGSRNKIHVPEIEPGRIAVLCHFENKNKKIVGVLNNYSDHKVEVLIGRYLQQVYRTGENIIPRVIETRFQDFDEFEIKVSDPINAKTSGMLEDECTDTYFLQVMNVI